VADGLVDPPQRLDIFVFRDQRALNEWFSTTIAEAAVTAEFEFNNGRCWDDAPGVSTWQRSSGDRVVTQGRVACYVEDPPSRAVEPRAVVAWTHEKGLVGISAIGSTRRLAPLLDWFKNGRLDVR
jgi:hypothetical protein